jgi:hypothetical protein
MMRNGPNPERKDQIFLVDPKTGDRTLWKAIAPADPVGILVVDPPVVSSDGRAYAYHWHRAVSDLYLVDGLR